MILHCEMKLLSPVTSLVWSNTLTGTSKALVVNCMKLNTLRGTKTAFLTPERHYEHRGLFLYGCPSWELSFHNDTTTSTNQNDRLDVQDTTETTISMWACAELIITLLSVLYHSDTVKQDGGRVDNVYTQFRLQQHVRT